ncbi:MAG: M23 family metallopeptidase [Gaiellales bacterium]
MSCMSAAPVGGGPQISSATPVPAILQGGMSSVAGANGGVEGGGGTLASSPKLAAALEKVWGAIGALKGAIDALQGAAQVAGGGAAPSGCGCGKAQAIDGAGAMGAPMAPLGPAPKGERPEPKPASNPADKSDKAKEASKLDRAPAGFKLKHPLAGAAKTSHFGHIASIRNNRPHSGVDLAKPTGAQITAPAAGKVSQVEMPVKGSTGGTGAGNFVVIDHGNGWFTKYAHLSGTDVKVGDVVAPGAKVGKVGSTGNSTGPHLHFEIYKGGMGPGKQVDPQPFLDGKKTF